jgi:D-sedoheptulose 7-phosphate isomerase
MDHLARIRSRVEDSVRIKQRLLEDEALLTVLQGAANEVIESQRRGGKTLFCGNGGSAADAQHLAAELSGRYYYDRGPLYAEALHVNTSYLTAVANDYSYQEIYSRLVRGMGRPGDVLIGLSTSGNAENVVQALNTANGMNLITVAFTGQSGGRMNELARYVIRVPSTDTPRIQECHILLGHILCEIVEASLFAKP